MSNESQYQDQTSFQPEDIQALMQAARQARSDYFAGLFRSGFAATGNLWRDMIHLFSGDHKPAAG